MKKYLVVAGIILVNLLLIFLALKLHFGYTEKIIRTTDTPNGLVSNLFIPLLLIGLLLSYFYKRIRRFGIGGILLSISCILFSVFYLNRSLATEGEYETYKLSQAIWSDRGFFLNISFNMWYNFTEVTQEKCLNVDSVQVRVDKGLFGMRTMTNNVRIVESSNCDHEDLDTNDLTQSHLDVGHELAQKRCFSAAIDRLRLVEPTT